MPYSKHTSKYTRARSAHNAQRNALPLRFYICACKTYAKHEPQQDIGLGCGW
jgi:hypothetical protein